MIEHGDPRGTFIALQLARAVRRDPIVSEEEQLLIDRLWTAWIGEPSTQVTVRNALFERGFWSKLEAYNDVLPDNAIAHASWGTVSHLEVWPRLEPQLATSRFATQRSLRSILVPSRDALAIVAQSGLRIEEVVLMFDMSRDPPVLVPITALPALPVAGG